MVPLKLVPPEIEREAEDVNVLLLLVEVYVVDSGGAGGVADIAGVADVEVVVELHVAEVREVPLHAQAEPQAVYEGTSAVVHCVEGVGELEECVCHQPRGGG